MSSIGLPPKTVETFYVELSPEERQMYDHMEGEAKRFVRNLINSGSLMRNYSTVLSIILRLRQLCDDMTLCPPELRSFSSSTSVEGKNKTVTYSHFWLQCLNLCSFV